MDTPQLVVVDLDGTAVGHHARLIPPTPAVVKALADTRAAGVPVAVATGRPLWDALRTIAELGLTDGLVTTTDGALTYDLGRQRIVSVRGMDPGPALRGFAEVDAELAFAVERDTSGWYYTSNFDRFFESTWAAEATVDEMAASEVFRLSVRMPGVFGARGVPCPVAARVTAEAGLDAGLYNVTAGYGGWIDVCSSEVSKATGAAAVASYYGVDAADTIVFGDAANDLPMFAWAGHAVAMGQSVDAIKEAADEVAPSVNEDGVAVVLRRWF
ncbi:MAG TPA: HAD family hydrolase [Stackebrandtia sp.]|jgi:hydroxymethylpyrimidine pyrophosphatase-like HAD family hydrolase|uniref:HAD family hydrolase n=1 Tax=Stackebrandtia sp. TaxID=2023065 RepID=UPI002D63F493|nr:HAD family hydrolase [Stackebrandtia sp.]HZE38720.1 HAD family hydrolase [Stackebrandtia sp.]